MKIKATIFLGIAALLLLSSCGGGETKTTPKGYSFTVIKTGDGKTVQPGEILIVDMAIVDSNDSTWYDNRKGDYPEMIRIGDVSKMEAERGIAEIFRMLSKGDSIEFKMRAKDLFLFMWRMDTPPGVDVDSYFTYYVKCREIFDEAEARTFAMRRDSIHEIHERARRQKEEQESKIAEGEIEAYNKKQIGKDTLIIDTYLKSKNVKAKTHPSGMRYIVKKAGDGPVPVKNDIVSIRYTGQFLDGKEFDSGEYSFRVGNEEVIKGWDIAAMNLQKGTSITLFIPSTLAYGRGGRAPVVGPDAILVFEMEMISINRN